MRIGIDIDGVLTDVCSYQIDLASKYYFLKEGKRIQNYKEYYASDMFGTDKGEEIELWNDILMDYAKNEPPRKFAAEVLNKLREEGHEIIIITARTGDILFDPEAEANMKEIVFDWLAKYEIPYDEIVFSKEKLESCIENKIDVMIEDKPANIYSVATEIPVYCYNAFYNENVRGKNITRVYSWYDIYAEIKELI